MVRYRLSRADYRHRRLCLSSFFFIFLSREETSEKWAAKCGTGYWLLDTRHGLTGCVSALLETRGCRGHDPRRNFGLAEALSSG